MAHRLGRCGVSAMAWLCLGVVGSFVIAAGVAQFGSTLPWKPTIFLSDEAGRSVGSLERGIGQTRLTLKSKAGTFAQKFLDEESDRIRPMSSVGPWLKGERPVSDRLVVETRHGFGWPVPAWGYRRTSTLERSGFVEEKVGAWRLPELLGAAARDLPAQPLWPGLAVDAVVWAVLLAASFVGVRRGVRGGRVWVRRRGGRCLECGYALGGAYADGCPECGWKRA